MRKAKAKRKTRESNFTSKPIAQVVPMSKRFGVRDFIDGMKSRRYIAVPTPLYGVQTYEIAIR